MTDFFLQNKWNRVEKKYSSLFFCGASTWLRVMPSLYEASRSHSYTPHATGFLCMSDKPEAEISTFQHVTLTKDRKIHALAWFEPTNPATEQPQTHAVDCLATGIGICLCTAFGIFYVLKFSCNSVLVSDGQPTATYSVPVR